MVVEESSAQRESTEAIRAWEQAVARVAKAWKACRGGPWARSELDWKGKAAHLLAVSSLDTDGWQLQPCQCLSSRATSDIRPMSDAN